jgi:hypothetical protein
MRRGRTFESTTRTGRIFLLPFFVRPDRRGVAADVASEIQRPTDTVDTQSSPAIVGCVAPAELRRSTWATAARTTSFGKWLFRDGRFAISAANRKPSSRSSFMRVKRPRTIPHVTT